MGMRNRKDVRRDEVEMQSSMTGCCYVAAVDDVFSPVSLAITVVVVDDDDVGDARKPRVSQE